MGRPERSERHPDQHCADSPQPTPCQQGPPRGEESAELLFKSLKEMCQHVCHAAVAGALRSKPMAACLPKKYVKIGESAA